MPSDERALATWLEGRDEEALARTLAARGVSPAAPWQDFFDAAEALLEPLSIDRALTRLPRVALTALTDAGAVAVPGDLALIAADGAPYAPVGARVEILAATHPDAFASHPPLDPPTQGGDAAAAERAFATAGSLADVMLAGLHAPLTRTGAGTVTATDRRRLVEAGIVSTAEQLDDLVASAAWAGLLLGADREWLVTDAGERWLELPTAGRWRVVVDGLVMALPAGLRSADGIVDPRAWVDAYPLDPDWPERAARLGRVAIAWGLLDPSGAEPSWTAGLRAGDPADTAALRAQLPAEIDKVYLQADLTAIAPGPLAPALDLRLRRIARRESRAQASTYRFTADSLTAGLTEDETADGIRAFLSELSLTGIPQPLEYLIQSTSARHGLVRVRTDAASGRTRVESDDAGVLEAIAVDQALRPVGLVHDDDGGLVSRVARDAVYWSLADARYPVVAVDAAGAPESIHRRTPAPPSTTPPTPTTTYATLIARLRAGHGTEGEGAWLERELDQAVRGRSTIVVDVRLPDGTERSFTLEASGLGGGRLRGRDRAADIERTLPVSHIIAVRPA